MNANDIFAKTLKNLTISTNNDSFDVQEWNIKINKTNENYTKPFETHICKNIKIKGFNKIGAKIRGLVLYTYT